MANVNKVILIGNVTRDPELRQTASGQAVADVGLAINRKYTANGEIKEETTFVDVTCWARLAEVVAQYAKKGAPLYVEGRLKIDTWEDKEKHGQKRSRTIVVAESIQLLGQRRGERQQQDDAGGDPF